MNFLLSLLLIFLFIFCLVKKHNAYQNFCNGVKNGVNLAFNILPYVVTVLLMVSLMSVSGVTSFLVNIFSPLLSFLGIPAELTTFVCLRPLTGSGSIAILSDLISTYGANSFISKCAIIIMCSTETTFFSASLYLSKLKNVSSFVIFFIALFDCFIAMILSCFFCKLFF